MALEGGGGSLPKVPKITVSPQTSLRAINRIPPVPQVVPPKPPSVPPQFQLPPLFAPPPPVSPLLQLARDTWGPGGVQERTVGTITRALETVGRQAVTGLYGMGRLNAIANPPPMVSIGPRNARPTTDMAAPLSEARQNATASFRPAPYEKPVTHRAGDVGQATGRSDIYVAPESAARQKQAYDMAEASYNILAGINNYIPTVDTGGGSGGYGGWGYGGYGGGGGRGYTGIANPGLYLWRIGA